MDEFTDRATVITQDLVATAEAVKAGARPPSAFVRTFRNSTVYCKASSGVVVGAEVSDVPGLGSWLPVFSSLERLGRFAGECDWLSAPGADVRALLPQHINIILDPDDEHALVLPRTGGESRG